MTTGEAEQALAEALKLIRIECRRRTGPPTERTRHPLDKLEFDAAQVEQWRAFVEALLA